MYRLQNRQIWNFLSVFLVFSNLHIILIIFHSIIANETGNVDIVMYILTHMDDKDSKDDRGRAAIHHMAQLSHTEGFKILIGMVLNKNPKDNTDDTPLHIAVRKNNMDIVKCLAKHIPRQELNCKNKAGHTPISIAYTKKHSKIYKFLLELKNQAEE